MAVVPENIASMKWIKTKFLGKGSYGTVSLAKPVEDTTPDCSRVSAVKSADYEYSSTLAKECKILYQLGGCHQIVGCYGADDSIENGKKIFNLLLEYAPGGTLADLIYSRGVILPEYEASMYAYMILMGLRQIHQKGYVHCDLKPANILVFPKSVSGILVNRLKIADFGLAKRAGCPSDIMRHGPLYKLRGTPAYSSPESVLMGLNEPPMDIWSLGCILIEILRGESPYSGAENLDELLENIASKDYVMKMPTFLSENATDFLKKCLTRDPRKRWTATMLLEHPFIVDNYAKLCSQHKALMSWEVDSTLSTSPSVVLPPQKIWGEIKLLDNPFIFDDNSKLFRQYESLKLLEDDQNRHNLWLTGQSMFSSSPSPMPFVFPPHHIWYGKDDFAFV